MDDYALVLNVPSSLKFCVFQRSSGKQWRLGKGMRASVHRRACPLRAPTAKG